MVFVVDKSLIIILFMYSITGVVLAGQYLIGDVFGFTLVSPVTGVPMKSIFEGIGQFNNFQAIEGNVTSMQKTDLFSFAGITQIPNQVFAWGNLLWNLFLIFTGSEVWQVAVFFGVPGIIVIIILVPYYILLIRTLIGYAKNFF